MRPRNRQRSYRSRRMFIAIADGLFTGLFAWFVCTQTVEQVFAVREAKATVVDLATRWTAAGARGNPAPKNIVRQAAAVSKQGGTSVSIVNFAFTPAEITIAPGESVAWSNDDGAPHGLAYDDGANGTDLLLPGATFSRRFDQPGTYDYHCAVHPYMTGRVIVRAK